MSFPIARPRTIRPAPVSWMTAMALFALVLTGCAATSGPSSSTAAEATLEPSVAAPTVTEPSVAASPTAEATASAAAEACLPAEIIAALEESTGGNFDPETPLNEVADALEALDFSRSEQDARWVSDAEFFRDDLVKNLRETDPNPMQLGFAVAVFRLDVLPEIPEC